MNDFWKKNSFPNLLVVLVLSIVLLWGAVGYGQSLYWSSKYRSSKSELDNIRTELESANSRQRELEEQVDSVRTITGECIEFVDREHEILITTGNTIQEIRAGFEDMERYINRLELYIYSIRDNTYNNTNK